MPVYVRLKINWKDYAADGKAPGGDADLAESNAFATFNLTPQL